MRDRGRVVTLILALLALAVLTSCSPNAPTPVQTPGNSNNCTVTGTGNTCVIGGGDVTVVPPTPSPSASPSGGDNVVKSFTIFCYGFGTVPPQTEPNHDACILPAGYPNIAVTASPKNEAKVDVPNPGDKTDEKVIDWRFNVTPSSAAHLEIQGDNRFNARVVPTEGGRVPGTVFTLTSIYTDPQKNVWVATKSGGIN